MQWIRYEHPGGSQIQPEGEGILVKTVADALNLMADADQQGIRHLRLHESQIIPDFFDLSSGLAGEVLQKFVTYQTKLTIHGKFASRGSESLKAFIRECNRGRHFRFEED